MDDKDAMPIAITSVKTGVQIPSMDDKDVMSQSVVRSDTKFRFLYGR